MDSYKTARFSKRFLGFIIDFILISLVVQLLSIVFKTPLENIFHLQRDLDAYNSIAIEMGIVDSSLNPIASVSSSTRAAFDEATKELLTNFNNNQFLMNTLLFGVGFIIFQFIIPLIFKDGRSIGKIIAKTKVVKKDGSPINVVILLVRNVLGLFIIEFAISLKLMFLPLTISAALCLAGDSKRSLHDYIAGTKVVEFYSDEEKQADAEQAKADKERPNSYHKKYKGFEFIDIEALEQNERMSKEALDELKKKHGIVDDDTIENTVEEPKNDAPIEEIKEEVTSEVVNTSEEVNKDASEEVNTSEETKDK